MKLRSLALVVAAASLVTASAAHALPSIVIVWRDTGDATIGTATTPSVTVSSTIIADVVITTDSTNVVNAVFITILFDNTELFALGGQELANVGLPGMGNFFAPLVAGTVTNNAAGEIVGFDQSAQLGQPGMGTGLTRTLGSVRFHVVAPSGTVGEADVIGFLDEGPGSPGIDAIGFSTGAGSAVFVGADVVPEPGSTTLGAFALATLLLIRSRRA